MASGLVLPVRPGTAVANASGGEGTLSLVVRSTLTDDIFAMSCSHVLARFGLGVGDPDDEIIVETGVDGSEEERQIAVLTDTFTTVNLNGPNDEDVALARFTTTSWVPEIPEIGCPATWRSAFGSQTDVWWYGAETGLGSGRIIGPMEDTIRLEVGDINVPAVGYRGVVAYSTSSQPGDSGAPVLLLNSTDLIGIHVGGNPSVGIAYFYPIVPIFQRHHLDLVIS